MRASKGRACVCCHTHTQLRVRAGSHAPGCKAHRRHARPSAAPSTAAPPSTRTTRHGTGRWGTWPGQESDAARQRGGAVSSAVAAAPRPGGPGVLELEDATGLANRSGQPGLANRSGCLCRVLCLPGAGIRAVRVSTAYPRLRLGAEPRRLEPARARWMTRRSGDVACGRRRWTARFRAAWPPRSPLHRPALLVSRPVATDGERWACTHSGQALCHEAWPPQEHGGPPYGDGPVCFATPRHTHVRVQTGRMMHARQLAWAVSRTAPSPTGGRPAAVRPAESWLRAVPVVRSRLFHPLPHESASASRLLEARPARRRPDSAKQAAHRPAPWPASFCPMPAMRVAG